MADKNINKDVKVKAIEKLFDDLWPICRSITGEGINRSFEILKKIFPFDIVDFQSGSPVLDWIVPEVWNVNEAYVDDEFGNRIIDFKKNNLHLMSYSINIDKWMGLKELNKNLFSIPEQENAIPYTTSYYKKNWGFSLTHKQRKALQNCKYHVVINSEFRKGNLKIGHAYINSTEGNKKEILLSTYLCHPSMANNELSGPLTWIYLLQMISSLKKRNYNYRFYIGPETIGSICLLSKFGDEMKKNCIGGYVLTCCGDGSSPTFKKSKNGRSLTDKSAINTLKNFVADFQVLDFFPEGSDERQYCSPGFNLPVGSIMRSMYGTYDEYHTSLDNKDLINFENIKEMIDIYFNALLSLEYNYKYINNYPDGEPMLTKHNLYNSIGNVWNLDLEKKKIMWLLNYSDTHHDLLSISDLSGFSVIELKKTADILLEKGLLSIAENYE